MAKEHCCICRARGKSADVSTIQNGEGTRVVLDYSAKETNRHVHWDEHFHNRCYLENVLPLIAYYGKDPHYKDSFDQQHAMAISVLLDNLTIDPDAQVFRDDETLITTNIKITSHGRQAQELSITSVDSEDYQRHYQQVEASE